MSKVLMFDLGGVLVENEMFTALRALMATDSTDADLKAKWLASPAARQFELGACTPKQFSTSIVAEFELGLEPHHFLEAFMGWPKGFSAETAKFLVHLREQYRIGCLSNSNQLHWTDQVTSLFDDAYSSHLIHQIKPDVEVFRLVTKDLGVSGEDIIFFDDSQPNVDAARAYGWEAHLTEGFEELKNVVGNLGIAPNDQ